MATLYVNFRSGPKSANADAHEAMTTSTSKADGTITTDGVSTMVELFSTAAHLVHIAPTGQADADSVRAFYVFPSFPTCVEVGDGCVVSAKSLA